jgi:hypothetical protein
VTVSTCCMCHANFVALRPSRDSVGVGARCFCDPLLDSLCRLVGGRLLHLQQQRLAAVLLRRQRGELMARCWQGGFVTSKQLSYPSTHLAKPFSSITCEHGDKAGTFDLTAEGY